MTWNFSVVWTNAYPLFLAFITTAWISALSVFLGSFLGSILGVLMLAPFAPLRWLARSVVEVFLAVPALVVLVWLYYSLPLLVPGLLLDAELVAVVGLGLSLSAFVGEIIRGGINAIPSGELEAAYLTGISRLQAIRYIILPQVIRRSWPPLMGQYITTYKFSTLASIIAVPELLHTSNSIIAQTYRPLEIYTAIAFVFFFTVLPLNIILRRIQKVEELGGTGGL